MAGILLVEDEGAIREKIMKNVNWTAHGFTPVLGAANGLEALELLQNYPVEIMVTDIQMPKMNGIELIKEVKKRGYRLKMIVISGFAEFEYARESITLNVCEYLLKPFATKRLLNVAVRLLEEIRKEQAEELELNKLRTQINNNIADLQEKFLTDLLNRNVSRGELDSKLHFFGLADCAGEEYQTVVMEIYAGHGVKKEEDKYLLSLQFYRQVRRILRDCPYRHLLINSYNQQIVTVFFAPDSELLMRLEEYLTKLRLYFCQEVTFGVSNIYQGLQDLSAAYREACVALRYRYLHGWDRVYSINDLHPAHPGYQKSLYLLYQNRIFDHLRIGAYEQIRHNLQSLFAEMRSSQMNPENIRMIGANLVLLACATLNELGYNLEEIFTGGFPSLSEISHTESLKELEEVITGFFTRINLMIKEKRASVNKRMIDEIRRYLEENYATEITLSAIADQYRISPGYLSLLFTEHTGANFTDYLTECRISKAMELLKHTQMRIYEIANAVGYNDPFYFSTCFKKITKKTPSEYREELGVCQE